MHDDLLVGTWRNPGGLSEVEFRIDQSEFGLRVTAQDKTDGELAEIYDVKWDGEALTFAAHWPSTGRLTKYRLQAVKPDVLNVRFTYSDQETWVRSD